MSEHEPYQILMMGFLDEELSPQEVQRFKDHVYQCPQCAQELVQYQKLNQLAASIKLKEPADHEWDRFLGSLHSRLERLGGWVFLTIGALLVLAYAIYELVFDPSIHVLLRMGLLAIFLGLALLFASVLRGRLRTRRYDKYQGVTR